MNELTAINVTDECADVYYEQFKSLPSSLRKKISCHMLHDIFKTMVVPAIDKARSLDREGREASE
jgi:hypothetical protein